MNTTDIWLYNRLEELAADIGRLRWKTRDTALEWTVDRIADRVWWLICRETPSAGCLVAAGSSVEQALAAADRETLRLKRLLGERTRKEG